MYQVTVTPQFLSGKEMCIRDSNIKDLVTGGKGKRLVFEEGAYLLLFGELPTDATASRISR